MARPAKKQEEALNGLLKQVESLDDDALWIFVCRLFPEAKMDFLEDVFDNLTVSRVRHESSRPLDKVIEDLDKRHGITR
jgi:hypothetical protein